MMNYKSISITLIVLSVLLPIKLKGQAMVNQSLSSSKNYIMKRTFTNEGGTSYLDIVDYFDGLGREEENIQIGISPSGKSLIKLKEYDGYGREFRKWNYGVTTGMGSYELPSAVKSKIQSSLNDKNPYTEINYRPNPLNQISSEFLSGENWLLENKKRVINTLSNRYRNSATLNTADSLICPKFVITGDRKNTSISRAEGFNYPANELLITKIINEDNCVTYEFRDKQDLIILIRQVNGNDLSDTYFIYDDYGNIRVVLSPLASKGLSADKNITENNTYISQYAYLYKYDDLNRCIAKKIPGSDWVYMVYDKSNMLTYFQDGNLRSKKMWKYFIYDNFSRVVIEGLINKETRSHTQLVNDISKLGLGTDYDSYLPVYGYSMFLPHQDKASVQKLYFYDSYDYLNLSDFSSRKSHLGFVRKTGYSDKSNTINSAKGMLTGVMTRVINNTSQYILSSVYYDERGRALQSRSVDYENYLTVSNTDYSFLGNKKKEHIERKGIGSNQETAFAEEYIYMLDHAERVIKISRIHQNTGSPVTLTELIYDELGRIKSQKHHSRENIEYNYNIRGWVTDIKNTNFTQNLYYEKDMDGSHGYFAGNISQMKNKSSSMEIQYNLQYDQANRLTYAFGKKRLSGGALKDDVFSEYYGYDLNTNPINLQRNGEGLILDQLTLTYQGNKLQKVSDAGGSHNHPDILEFNQNSTENIQYKYDANANLIADLNKQIVAIRYNYLNLPDTIQFQNGNQIIYRYMTDGTKMSTKYVTYPFNLMLPLDTVVKYGSDPVQTTEEYLYGSHQYSKMNNGGKVLTRILTPNGYIRPNTSASDLLYCYYIKDHQGNNRSVIAYNTQGVRSQIQSTDYYPSGVVTAISNEQSEQPYKYSGKQLIRMHGLDWYDYGARLYDPVLTRFTTHDPLAEEYYAHSPYAYCLGNSIMFIDPDGKKVKDAFIFLQTEIPKFTNLSLTVGAQGGGQLKIYGIGFKAMVNLANVEMASFDKQGSFTTRGNKPIEQEFTLDAGISKFTLLTFARKNTIIEETTTVQRTREHSIGMLGIKSTKSQTQTMERYTHKVLNTTRKRDIDISNIEFDIRLLFGIKVEIDANKFDLKSLIEGFSKELKK